jgi:multiple sugar transport system ATP-binding protein
MDQSGTLTVKEVAAFLRITPQAVYNMIKREEIAAFKVGSAVRILRTDLDEFIERGKRLFAAQNAVYEAPADGTVAARRLCARFGGARSGKKAAPTFALDAVSFEIPVGSTLGIVGPSGSGKTLLLKALAGLIPLDAGALFIGTKRLDLMDPRDRSTGLVFQDYALYPMLDGGGNIAFPLRLGKAAKESIDPAVERIAAELGIEREYLARQIEALPEGIKQLVAIGRAENKPVGRAVELFLMDEPLIHLDARMREDTRAFLKRLVASIGSTTIYAFNEAADALALSDRLLVLRDGGVVQFGLTPEVFRRPADANVMELLSLNGLTTLAGDYAEGAVSLEAGDCVIPAQPGSAAPDGYRGPVSVCFRPEETEVAEPKEKGALAATIDRSVPYDGERVLASGRLLRRGKMEAQEGAPKVGFIAPMEAEERFVFRPTAAVAFPI